MATTPRRRSRLAADPKARAAPKVSTELGTGAVSTAGALPANVAPLKPAKRTAHRAAARRQRGGCEVRRRRERTRSTRGRAVAQESWSFDAGVGSSAPLLAN